MASRWEAHWYSFGASTKPMVDVNLLEKRGRIVSTGDLEKEILAPKVGPVKTLMAPLD